MKINIVGSLLGTSGYDIHCKQLSNALYKINPDIKLDVPLSPDYLNHVTDAELKMIKTESRVPDVTIAIMTPPFWRVALGDQTDKFIGFCVWEGDKIPKYWIEYLADKRVDQIWVPSQHTKDAIWNTYWHGATQEDIDLVMSVDCLDTDFWKKIKIVPHGVDIDLFKPDETKKQEKFTFLCNKGWRGGMEDRGGVQYLLKAFAEEFSKDENVQLMLKINPAYINPEQIGKMLDELKLPKDRPKINISADMVSYNKIPALYQEADCYVCSTRAESFDLGTAEAMACGLPIITTNYGGQIEHMDETCAKFIDYDLEEVKDDIMYEGIKWAVPKVQHLQELLRASFSKGRITREDGGVSRKFISDFTWDKTAQKAMDFLK